MKTKKSLVVLAVITLVFALVFTACSNGSTGGGGKDTGSTQGQLAFERITSGENAGTWRVRKGTFKGGALVIPAYYNGSTGRAARGVEDGEPVTEIGASEDDEWSAAFRDSGITSVEIPDTVKLIGGYAFGWNQDITSITIPASVTQMICPFLGCKNLKDITVDSDNPHYSSEDGITYTNIVGYPYEDLTLQYTEDNKKTVLHSYPSASGSVTIKGVTRIGVGAFQYTGITDVTIPSGVTHIVIAAFESCTSLNTITIPPSVTDIGGIAFGRCTNISSITIPSSVERMGHHVFAYWTSSQTINVPFENQAAADTAWGESWRLQWNDSQDNEVIIAAKINYNGQ